MFKFMKTNWLLFLLLIVFISCDEQNGEFYSKKQHSEIQKTPLVAGDNEYDVLGYGCDATGK